MKWFLWALVILLALTGLLSLLIFRFIFGRPKRTTKVPKYYQGTPHYIAGRKGMALMEQIPMEDVLIQSRDGLKLHARLYRGEGEPKKFILGIHGYRSYARPEFGPYIAFYRSLGYSMLLPDDRAHGPSEGKYIGFGVLDRLDCIDWAKYLVERFGEDTEIRLHGVSMGAATVLAASGEAELPEQVKGIVSDCGYTSAWEVLAYQFKHSAHLPVKPFLPICQWLCRHLAGFDLHEFAPIDQVKKARVPILFVHGTEDAMVPVDMVYRLYEACGSEKRLLVVEKAGHGQCITTDKERYEREILDFFHLGVTR